MHRFSTKSRLLYSPMKYTFVFLLFLAAAISPLQPTSAQSDATSLALLVKTLNSTDNPEVRTILMRGMLSGLAGRRNVDRSMHV